MKKSIFHIIFPIFFFSINSCSKENSSNSESFDQENVVFQQEPETPLKEKTDSFFVGVAVSTNRLSNGSDYDKIITSEFESVTAEYQMKMNVILPNKNNYNWTKADQIVNYAIDNNLNIHGHALIWHNSTPDWLKNFQGTNEEFEQEVKDYITNVVSRYKGKIKSWDVVNEGVSDSGGELRNTVFLERMGEDYMAKCFEYARMADPDVLLFYNDYGMTRNISKQNKVYDLIQDWKNRNIPIDGIGYQMHISYLRPFKSEIESATNRAVENNLILHFSELDIRMNPDKSLTELNLERANSQKEKYKEVVQVYNSIPIQNKYAITLWGLKDNDSWLLQHHDNYYEWPLLFDENFKIKKAHTGFLEGLD